MRQSSSSICIGTARAKRVNAAGWRGRPNKAPAASALHLSACMGGSKRDLPAVLTSEKKGKAAATTVMTKSCEGASDRCACVLRLIGGAHALGLQVVNNQEAPCQPAMRSMGGACQRRPDASGQLALLLRLQLALEEQHTLHCCHSRMAPCTAGVRSEAQSL